MQNFVKHTAPLSFNTVLTNLKDSHHTTWSAIAERAGVSKPTLEKYRKAPTSMPMGMVNNIRFAMDLSKEETDVLFDSLCAEIHKAWTQMTIKKRDIKAHFKKKGAAS